MAHHRVQPENPVNDRCRRRASVLESYKL